MKLVVLWGIVSATAGAHDLAEAAQRKVVVCLLGFHDVLTVNPAIELARDIYAKIGVAVDWRYQPRSCPADAILGNLRDETPDKTAPGALGYATPSEGTYFEIFCDRILKTVEPRLVPILFAHVLVHESAHILQGMARHSATGMMKPVWRHPDFSQMAWAPLPFTPEDVTLIHLGLDKRALRLTSSRR